MNKIYSFILGLIAGIIITVVTVNIVRSNSAVSAVDETAPTRQIRLLHANMPQDSVVMILGNPQSTSSEILGGVKVDNWQYQADGNVTANLLFSNGRLNSISYSR